MSLKTKHIVSVLVVLFVVALQDTSLGLITDQSESPSSNESTLTTDVFHSSSIEEDASADVPTSITETADPSAWQTQAETGSSAFGEYKVGPNDVLEISVYGEDDLSQRANVTSGGYITYPLLGRIKAAGMTVLELEEYIREALAKEYIRNPQVRISVQEFSNLFVIGQVLQPGPFPFKGGMTVLEAVTTAGGFTKIANKRKVKIVRTAGEGADGKMSMTVNVANVINGKDEDIFLQPGDTVIVPESFF